MTRSVRTFPFQASRLLPASSAVRWTVGWLLAAAWALSFPLVSSLGPHRLWGWCAGGGYLAAAGAGVLGRRRVAVGAALLGAVAVPLLYLVLTGRGQSEVAVIERSGRLLLQSGRLYVDQPAGVEEYTPYLPGMALLGLPRALLGGGDGWAVRLLGDARIWCAAVFLLCLHRARLTLRRSRPTVTPTGGGERMTYGTGVAALIASPVVALPLCV
ncbi:hypothetical protein ACWGIP_36245, partial [Streptomyces sp. NPDC054838]